MHMVQGHRLAAWFCVVAAAVPGCSTSEEVAGAITLNLTGRGESGAMYRLRDASITVQGPTSTQEWNTEDDPTKDSLSADVEVGEYSAVLHDGWHIERVDGAGAVEVSAMLLSDNPTQFMVHALRRTSVALQFRVNGDTIDLSQGYDIGLGVQEVPLLAVSNAFDEAPASIVMFRASDAGNASPLRTITGLSTQLRIPTSIAVANGELIVANVEPQTINVYSMRAHGDIAPIRQITGVVGQFEFSPGELKVFQGEIYASGSREIQVFPLAATGSVAPSRTIEGISGLRRFALDEGELYATISDRGGARVAVYPSAASGPQSPIRTITIPKVDWCPNAIAVHNGLIYVSDVCDSSIAVLPKTASGSTNPIRVIVGTSTRLVSPGVIAIFDNELYVVDSATAGNSAVRVYPLDAVGDAAPTRLITGTALSSAIGMAVF